jgi:hypothetical protein
MEKNLIALPAVIRTLPAPVQKFVGNWANEENELVGFELIAQDKPNATKRSRKRRGQRARSSLVLRLEQATTARFGCSQFRLRELGT